MAMSKKDFIALADYIRDHNEDAGVDHVFTSVHLQVLANFCRAQNPRFVQGRWIGYIRGENGSNGGAIRCTEAQPCEIHQRNPEYTRTIHGAIRTRKAGA